MTCKMCGRALDNAEPSYRVTLSWLVPPGDRLFPHIGYICERCVMLEEGPGMDRAWQPPPRECQNCGRRVIYDLGGRQVPLFVVCGPECRQALYLVQARVRYRKRLALVRSRHNHDQRFGLVVRT